MEFIFKIISDDRVGLFLVADGNIVDKVGWKENNNLSQKLLLKIDQILRKNKIGLDKISGCEIISKVPKNWTSCRIAKSTFDSLGIARKFQL